MWCNGINIVTDILSQFVYSNLHFIEQNFNNYIVDEQGAFMAESQTFYASYAPAMDVLKHKGKSLKCAIFLCFFLLALFRCSGRVVYS